MIPYEQITFNDWDFYWGRCTLLTNQLTGKWEPVMPHNREYTEEEWEDEDGEMRYDEREELLYSPYTTLERLEESNLPLQFTRFRSGELFEVPALTPFKSKGWVTYCPKLGYYVVAGKLVYLQNTVPRNRDKGLYPRRLLARPPLTVVDADGHVCGSPSTEMMWESLLQALCDRLNEPLDLLSWTTSLKHSIKEGVPVVLNPSTATIPHDGGSVGIVQRCTYTGTARLIDDKLVFEPVPGTLGEKMSILFDMMTREVKK